VCVNEGKEQAMPSSASPLTQHSNCRSSKHTHTHTSYCDSLGRDCRGV